MNIGIKQNQQEGIFMALFWKKPKRGTSLEDMIADSERKRELILSTFLNDHEIDECPVYKNDHWEIEYFIRIHDKLEEALSNRKISFVFSIADTFNFHSMPGDEYMPLPLLFFQVDGKPENTFVLYANSLAEVGRPGMSFKSLDYLWILLKQPEITLTLKGKNKCYSMTISNPAKDSSLLFDLRNHMNTSCATPGGRDRYLRSALQYWESDQHEASKKGISVGQYCFGKYRMIDLNL